MNHEVNYYTGLTTTTPKKISLAAQKEISKRNVLVKVMVVISKNIIISGYFHVPSDMRASDYIQLHKDDMTVLTDVTINSKKSPHPTMVKFSNCDMIQLLDDSVSIKDRK